MDGKFQESPPRRPRVPAPESVDERYRGLTMNVATPQRDDEEQAGRPSTEALSDRARANCQESLSELYVRLVPDLMLWVRLRKKSGLGLPIEPEDLVSEVWVRVVRDVNQFDASRGSFRKWIFGYTKHVWSEMNDPHRRLGRHLPTTPESAMHKEAAAITSVTRAVARNEMRQRFAKYVEGLDPLDRDIYLLHHVEGLACVRVAELLDVSPDLVSKRWQRLQQDLRESGFGRAFAPEG